MFNKLYILSILQLLQQWLFIILRKKKYGHPIVIKVSFFNKLVNSIWTQSNREDHIVAGKIHNIHLYLLQVYSWMDPIAGNITPVF